MTIPNDTVSTKIYDKRDDLDFEIVKFPFLDGDVPRYTSYKVYIYQLIRFARVSNHVADFNTRYLLLTQKIRKQGYQYHKLSTADTLISYPNSMLDLNLSRAMDFRKQSFMAT